MPVRDIFAEQPKAEQKQPEAQTGVRDIFADTGPFLSEPEQQRFETQRQQLETPKQMFTGELRQTEITEALPEFRETSAVRTPELGLSGTKMTAGLLTSFTPQGQIKVIKEAIPESRFFKDSKGNIIVDVDGERSVLNKPGLSGQDAVRSVFQFLSFLPTTRAAALANTVKAKVGLGAVGAAGTEQAIQEVSRLAGSEEERAPLRTLGAAALGAAGEAITPIRQARAESRFARQTQIRPQEISAQRPLVEAAQEAAGETGIPLTRAQQVATPELIEKQSFLAQLPAGNKKAAEVLTTQNRAAGDAVQEFIEGIAPSEAIVRGPERFRTASQKAVDAQRVIRKEKTSPIYKEAFKNKEKLNVDNVVATIDDKLTEFPETGQVSKSLRSVKEFVSGENNLQKLHNAKLEIDQLITKTGEGSLGNTTKSQLLEIQDELLQTMDSISPEYRAARELFSKESAPVDAIKNSILGKIANFKDTDLKRISRTIFDPAETDPKIVANARKSIESIDPGAWDDLLRVELERRMGDMTADIAEGGLLATENTPAFLKRALFGPPGNPKPRRILFSAVSPEQKKNLTYLETALKRASLGRPGGSQTAIRQEIEKELRGGISNSIRNIFKNPVKQIVDTGDDAAFNNRVRAMSEAIFSPEYVTEMKEIRNLGPGTAAASKAFTQLINKINQQIEQGER